MCNFAEEEEAKAEDEDDKGAIDRSIQRISDLPEKIDWLVLSRKMSSLSRELVFLILQFLDEEKFNDTVHSLEQDSGYFLNVRHFEELAMNGDWDEVEKYLSGFTKVDDNRYSMKILFEIRKQKYLEALDKNDQRAKAVEILLKDLKSFSTFNEDLFKKITYLLTLENFRSNEQLSKYGDTKSARAIMLAELKKLIEANSMFHDKLNFPTLKNSSLRTLINQSLNWQPKPNPYIKTLFVDHSCGQLQPNGAHASSLVTNPFIGALIRGHGFPPLVAHSLFQQAPAALQSPLEGWMTNQAPIPHAITLVEPMGFTLPNNSALLKRPRSPNNLALEYPTADLDHVPNGTRPLGLPDETPAKRCFMWIGGFRPSEVNSLLSEFEVADLHHFGCIVPDTMPPDARTPADNGGASRGTRSNRTCSMPPPPSSVWDG